MGYARRRRWRWLRSQSPNRKPRPRHPLHRLRSPCRQLQNLSVGPRHRLGRKPLLTRHRPRQSPRYPQFLCPRPFLSAKHLQQSRWRAVGFRMLPRHRPRPRRAQLLQPFMTCLRPLAPRKMRLEPQEERRAMRLMGMPLWQRHRRSRPERVPQGSCLVHHLRRLLMGPHPQSHPSRNNLQLVPPRTLHLRHRHPFPGPQILRHSPRRHPRGPKYRNHLLLLRRRTQKLRPLLSSRRLAYLKRGRTSHLQPNRWTWTSHQRKTPTRRMSRQQSRLSLNPPPKHRSRHPLPLPYQNHHALSEQSREYHLVRCDRNQSRRSWVGQIEQQCLEARMAT